MNTEAMPELLPNKTPWSSIVGGGFMLHDKSGKACFKVMVIGTTDGINKEQDGEICERLMKGWNAYNERATIK